MSDKTMTEHCVVQAHQMEKTESSDIDYFALRDSLLPSQPRRLQPKITDINSIFIDIPHLEFLSRPK